MVPFDTTEVAHYYANRFRHILASNAREQPASFNLRWLSDALTTTSEGQKFIQNTWEPDGPDSTRYLIVMPG
jgi:hypothetical protein